MVNLASIRVRAKANFQCQQCGSMELVQGHHEIPHDENSLIALCAFCHSRKHPGVPTALFFSRSLQPYWYNKSAATLARQLGVHSRTIIRVAKRLGIITGDLLLEDEERIRMGIPKLQRKPKVQKIHEPIIVEIRSYFVPKNMRTSIKIAHKYCGILEASLKMGIHTSTIYRKIFKGELPAIRINGYLRIPRKLCYTF